MSDAVKGTYPISVRVTKLPLVDLVRHHVIVEN
jgi:hypothetical protein